jgi:hypothetical protein
VILERYFLPAGADLDREHDLLLDRLAGLSWQTAKLASASMVLCRPRWR